LKKGTFVAILGTTGQVNDVAKHFNRNIAADGWPRPRRGMDTHDENLLLNIRKRSGWNSIIEIKSVATL
jgi:hypothetical protein